MTSDTLDRRDRDVSPGAVGPFCTSSSLNVKLSSLWPSWSLSSCLELYGRPEANSPSSIEKWNSPEEESRERMREMVSLVVPKDLQCWQTPLLVHANDYFPWFFRLIEAYQDWISASHANSQSTRYDFVCIHPVDSSNSWLCEIPAWCHLRKHQGVNLRYVERWLYLEKSLR